MTRGRKSLNLTDEERAEAKRKYMREWRRNHPLKEHEKASKVVRTYRRKLPTMCLPNSSEEIMSYDESKEVCKAIYYFHSLTDDRLRQIAFKRILKSVGVDDTFLQNLSFSSEPTSPQ